MEGAAVLRRARKRAGFTLRALAKSAETSHSALAAYESGRVAPTVDTLERIVTAAGFTVTLNLERRIAADADRSRELIDVLELAEQFPARHRRTIEYPVFPRAS